MKTFALLSADLLPTDGLPAAFFCADVVDEIRRRWKLSSRVAFGSVCTVCTEAVGADEEAMVLDCKHVFHRECVAMWLAHHSTCPNCRAPAAAARLTPVTAAGAKASPTARRAGPIRRRWRWSATVEARCLGLVRF